MCLGTVDAWLIWRLTGGRAIAVRPATLRDPALRRRGPGLVAGAVRPLRRTAETLPPGAAVERAVRADQRGARWLPDGTPILAVLADSHAALFGQGGTEVGVAKATYGTGTSVMTPVAELSASEGGILTTLAWVLDGSPTYALEGNILSSGATLAWAADLLTDGRVADLIALAETVSDSGGVTLVPAFSGLGAPHWDREAHALISGMSPRPGAPTSLALLSIPSVIRSAT